MPEFYRTVLENMCNVIFNEELNSLFGEKSFVKINHCYWSFSQRSYIVDATINVTSIMDAVPVFPIGLEYIIEEAWKFIAMGDRVVVISSIT